MTKPTKRTVKAWAVMSPHILGILTRSIYRDKKSVMNYYSKKEWAARRRQGYRCVPVIISERKR